MEHREFNGKWISGILRNYGDNDEQYFLNHRNTILENSFMVKDIVETKLYIASLGYYIIKINDCLVCDYELNSDWTVYKKIVYYDEFDITQFLKVGKNKIEIELGNGMYNPSPLKLFGKYNLRERLTEVGEPAIICDIETKKEIILKSDENWKLFEGNILFNNLYLGERVDLNLQVERVENTRIVNTTKTMIKSKIPKVKRFNTVVPTSIKDTNIYDFNQMISGFINIRLHAKKNQKVIIQYSEAINDNHLDFTSSLVGSVGSKIGLHCIDGGKGAPKKAIQQDEIICKEGINVFTNKFTYHSFRYLEIKGIEKSDIEEISATFVHTDLKEIGNIKTDNIFLNELFDIGTRTKLNNVHSVFEDCARERLGYGGDIVSLAKSNLYMFDLDTMYRKTILDFRLEQDQNGGIPETAPYVGIQTNGTGNGNGPLLWQYVYPYLIMKHYQFYGDKTLIEDEYKYVKKQVDFLMSIDEKTLINCCLGDHGSVLIAGQFRKDTPDKKFIGYCTVLAYLKTISYLGKVINKDIKVYQEAFEKLKHKVILKFKNNDDSFGEKTQSGYAFALALKLGNEEKLINQFVNKIKEDNYIFNSGIFAMTLSFDLLSKYGFDEVVEKWLLNDSSIGYKQMLKNGNKALAELFSSGGFSLNHAMFSSYQQWYFESLAGIKVQDKAIGADSILFKPYFSKNINKVECSFQTKQGAIYSKWKRTADGIWWELSIPENLKEYDICYWNEEEIEVVRDNNNFKILLKEK